MARHVRDSQGIWEDYVSKPKAQGFQGGDPAHPSIETSDKMSNVKHMHLLIEYAVNSDTVLGPDGLPSVDSWPKRWIHMELFASCITISFNDIVLSTQCVPPVCTWTMQYDQGYSHLKQTWSLYHAHFCSLCTGVQYESILMTGPWDNSMVKCINKKNIYVYMWYKYINLINPQLWVCTDSISKPYCKACKSCTISAILALHYFPCISL